MSSFIKNQNVCKEKESTTHAIIFSTSHIIISLHFSSFIRKVLNCFFKIQCGVLFLFLRVPLYFSRVFFTLPTRAYFILYANVYKW